VEKVKQTAPTLTLNAGSFLEEQYQNYNEMVKSSTENWDYKCTYELRPRALTGLHQILQLESMMISLVVRPGGMMHDVLSAKDSISFAVHIDLEDKACLDRMKCQKGDIVLFDDAKPYNYMTNAKVELSVITIHKDSLGEMLPTFEKAIMHKYTDTDGKLGIISKEIWKAFTSSTPHTNYKEAEERVLNALRMITENQEAMPAVLTKCEESAWAIREQVYQHMDGNLQVSDFAKQYKISEKGLQNAFKSLFGFTPKLFMRQLKLNLVRHDLSQNVSEQTNVMRIAHKWGFQHMGRFSKFYTDLFEENPSETLKKSSDDAKAFTGKCIARQEEIQ